MSTIEEQLESFRTYVLEQTRNGGSELTMDELYENWRLEHLTEEELREDELALEASLRDMEAGETGRPFEEFDAEFRARHGLIDQS